MSAEIKSQLQDVFRQVFNKPDLVITQEMTSADVKGWDSLKHVELIVSVESVFNVKFKAADVAAMKTVGDLIEKVMERRK